MAVSEADQGPESTSAVPEDLRRLGAGRTGTAVVVAISCVIGAALGARALLHPGAFNPLDLYRYFRPAGNALLGGHLARVYAGSGVQAGPLELLWQAGWYHLGRVCSLPGASLLGAASGAGIALLCALSARVASRSWGSDHVHRSLAAALGGLLGGLALTPLAVHSGHPAEVVIPCLWVLAASVAARRPLLAGVLIGIGTGWEVWSLLGLAILLLAGWRRALRAGVLAGAISAAFLVPFVLAGPFEMFAHQWAVMPDTLFGTLLPSVTPATWWMRVLQAAVVSGAGALVVWRFRAHPQLCWVLPLVLAVARLVTDPLDIYYYWLELRVPLVIAVAALVATGKWRGAPSRRWAPAALGVAVALCWVSPEAAISITIELLALITVAVAVAGFGYLAGPVPRRPGSEVPLRREGH